MIKLKSLLQDAKYVAQKDGASITFDADSDTDAERQAVQMQATRPKEIDYEENTAEAQGPMNPEWTYQDAAGRTHKGHVKDVFDRGGTDVTYAFVDKDTGEYSMVSGSRLKAAKRSGTSPMWVKEQGIGFPGVEPGTIPADYPDRKKKVAAARKQADRMRNEYKFPYEAPRIGDKVTYTGKEHERLAGKTGTVVQIDHDRIKVQWSDGSSSVHFGNVLQRESIKEADKPSLTAQLKAAKKASKDFDDHYTTIANQDHTHDSHNTFVNNKSFELRQIVVDLEKKLAAQRTNKGLKEAVQFRKGQTVQHFTNPKAQAVVVRYDPPKEYPEYGKGSWNNHSFAGGQGLLTVKFPNGHTETDFEGYWKPTKKEDKVVNEERVPRCAQCGHQIKQWAKTAIDSIKMCPKCKGIDSDTKKPISEAIAWDVFLNGKNIDTVWSTDTNPESMKRSLVNHDGYDSRITVQPAKTSSRGPRQKKESVQEGGVWDQVCPKCGKKPPRELRVWSDQSKCPLCSTPYNSTTNEAYKALRPLRKLIREELQQMLKESVVLQGTYQGFMISYSGAPGIGGTASVTKRGVPKEKFDDELSDAYKILSAFRATKSGSTWGTDGIGYIMNKEQGLVNVKKSGVVAKNAKAAFASLGLSV